MWKPVKSDKTRRGYLWTETTENALGKLKYVARDFRGPP